MTTKAKSIDTSEAAIEKAKVSAEKLWKEDGLCFAEIVEYGFLAGYAAAKEEAWHPIRSEDDLPKVDGEYLVSERTGCDGVITETYDCRNGKFSYHDPEAGGWIPYDHTDFIAWMPFPAPYTEPQTQPHQCNGVDGAERHGTANRCTICGRYSSQWNEGEPQTGGKV
jgi:hypothetical protein